MLWREKTPHRLWLKFCLNQPPHRSILPVRCPRPSEDPAGFLKLSEPLTNFGETCRGFRPPRDLAEKGPPSAGPFGLGGGGRRPRPPRRALGNFERRAGGGAGRNCASSTMGARGGAGRAGAGRGRRAPWKGRVCFPAGRAREGWGLRPRARPGGRWALSPAGPQGHAGPTPPARSADSTCRAGRGGRGGGPRRISKGFTGRAAPAAPGPLEARGGAAAGGPRRASTSCY